ncbi:mariner-Tc1 transposon family protein [Ascosphaera apis ARSEF 7405]|uniref:Mariner-Tc1 transposon family protein n=1 Tax=Ascosphaera apis ARSEF 7405 TaxID=392613 RepID=A0A166P591_9EURO|nr:mariner-Tc1 transposon family protein [Ascosphaera apis ARSEF 7405]
MRNKKKAPVKGRRKVVTLQQKKALRAYDLSTDRSLSGKQLAEWFQDRYGMQLSKSDVSKYRNDASLDKIQTTFNGQDRIRRREEHWPQIEEALSTWVINKQGQIPITGDVLREKSVFFWTQLHPERDPPSFSNGWLYNFLRRHQITSRLLHGEASSVSDDVEQKIQPIRDLVKEYQPKDVFNCDESSLFWRMIPDRSYTTQSLPGRKKDKSRITAHFCCNADGSERLPIWWIGTAKSPHAFRQAQIHNMVHWRWNKKAWMTATIFEEWLQWFDNRMRHRKVLLLLDNFSAHTLATTQLYDRGQLLNTRIVFLPPNTTSVYQPLDQGIIASFKAHWRARWIQFILHENEKGHEFMNTMNVLFAIRWGNMVWDIEVKNETIRNCFQKGLQLFNHDNLLTSPYDAREDIAAIIPEYERLTTVSGIRNLMKIENFLNPEEETVEDPSDNVEEHIIESLTSKIHTPQEDEDEGFCEEATEKVSYTQCFEALRILILFEEQRKDGTEEMIRIFWRHQHNLKVQEMKERKQGQITDFFHVK